MGPDDMSKGRAEASRASDPTPPVIKPNEILSLPSGYVELNNFQAQARTKTDQGFKRVLLPFGNAAICNERCRFAVPGDTSTPTTWVTSLACSLTP